MATSTGTRPGAKASPQKEREKNPEPEVDPRLLKWLFIGVLAALFTVGIILQFDYLSAKPKKDPNEEIRKRLGMDQADPNATAAPAPFMLALQKMTDADVGIRLAAMSELMTIDAVKGAPYIAKMLVDADPLVRAEAVGILQRYQVKGFSGQIAGMLLDGDATVRIRAGSMLSESADPGVIYSLSSALASSDPAVVSNALSVWKTFANQNTPAAIGSITVALSSQDDAILQDAIAAIDAKIPAKDASALTGLLEGIKARKAETPPGNAAIMLLEKIKAATAPPPMPGVASPSL